MEVKELQFIKGKTLNEAKKLVEPFWIEETRVDGVDKYVSAELHKKRILVETSKGIITKIIGNY
jgi:hypothetical protein